MNLEYYKYGHPNIAQPAEQLQKQYSNKYLIFIWQFQAQYYTYAIERPNFTSDKKWAIYLPILGYINVEIAEM